MTCKDKILEDLIHEDYNDGQLLEQYKLYVEMADHVSERRDKTNRFYLGLITSMITLSSVIFSINSNAIELIIIILICSCLICWNWHQNILSYKRLNSGKFDVINHIENKLSAKGFTVEWDLVKLGGYNDLTNIEKNIPLYFLCLCSVILFAIIIQYL